MDKKDKPDVPDSVEEDVFLYNLLKKMGCDGDEALIFTKIMFKTISEPVLERMDDQFHAFRDSIYAKLDAQKDSMDAQKDSMDAQKDSMDAQMKSMDAQLSNLRWLVGVGVAMLVAAGIFNVLTNLFNWGAS